MHKLTVLILLVAFHTEAFGRKGFDPFHFQIDGTRYLPQGWSSSAFIHLGWTPTYRTKSFVFRGEFGASGPRNALDERFLTLNYQAFVFHPLFSLVGIEAGAGLQTWFDPTGGTAPIVTGNLVLDIGMGFVTRMFMGYSRFFLPNNPVNQFTSGIGIRLS